MPRIGDLAPELAVGRWLNTDRPLSLASLRGRPVLLHAFQLLCPGCVAHGLPQAVRAHRLFGPAGLRVIGLHTVFEHHAAMGDVTLVAFLHEYRIGFPVAVDLPGDPGPVPQTMRAYALEGTPSLVLIGGDGRIVHRSFGSEDDLALGARIGEVLGMGIDGAATGETCRVT